MGGVESCEPRNRSLHGSRLPGCGPARGSRAALCLTCCGRRSQVTRRPLAVGTERPCTSPWGHRGHADGLVSRNATCSVSCHSGGSPALCEVTSSVPVTVNPGGVARTASSVCPQEVPVTVTSRVQCRDLGMQAVTGGNREQTLGSAPRAWTPGQRARRPGFVAAHRPPCRRARRGWPASQGPGPSATGFRRS